MNEYWRIQARHATVCPLCRGYIKIGDWIVKVDGQKRWSHAACPLRTRSTVIFEEEESITPTMIRYNITKEGKVEQCPMDLEMNTTN